MPDRGSIAKGSQRTARRVTDYRPSRASPIPYRVLPAGIRGLLLPVEYPEQYWMRPLVMDGRRGQLNWTAGSDSLWKTAYATTTAQDPDGWRWNGPWIERMGWRVDVGANRLTVKVRASTDAPPRPSVRVLASARLGVAEVSAQAAPGAGQWQTIELELTAITAGIVTLQLEWLQFTERQNCVWRNVTLSTP